MLKIDIASLRAVGKAVERATSNPNYLYNEDARAKTAAAVEELKDNAREVGAPEEVVNAITTFISDDGHIYVGIPREHPAYETAFNIEYGTPDGQPRPFLRTLKVDWK